MTLRALILIFVTIAFGLAPVITPFFQGYDPARFPVVIAQPAVQPAGFSFAIWSVIYLWLIAHAGFGYFARARSLDWDETRPALLCSLGIGIFWLFAAKHMPLLAAVMILLMLAFALVAFLQADEDYDRWLLSAPLAIYAGWLSAAASVSTGVVLAGYGILSDRDAALVMIAIVLILASSVQWVHPTMPVYGATVIWALLGIAIANLNNQLIVAIAATAAAAGVGFVTWYGWMRKRSRL